jgi:hypothetical protein
MIAQPHPQLVGAAANADRPPRSLRWLAPVRIAHWLSIQHSLASEAVAVVGLYAPHEAARGLVVGNRRVAVDHAQIVASLERRLRVMTDARPAGSSDYRRPVSCAASDHDRLGRIEVEASVVARTQPTCFRGIEPRHHGTQHRMVGADPEGFSEEAHILDCDVEREIPLNALQPETLGSNRERDPRAVSCRASPHPPSVEQHVDHATGCD